MAAATNTNQYQQSSKKHRITYIFWQKGQTLSCKDALKQLMALNPTNRYNSQIAKGSIGGSISNGYLERNGSMLKCTRDAK